MQEQYEYQLLTGKPKENTLYKYSVDVNDLNEVGEEGWLVAYPINDGHSVMMYRKVQDLDRIEQGYTIDETFDLVC